MHGRMRFASSLLMSILEIGGSDEDEVSLSHRELRELRRSVAAASVSL